MQVKKELIQEHILSSARHEFMEHGFHDASLRRIAKKAETTPGNLYNYFKNKDELFCALTKETIATIKHVVEARPAMINYERFSDPRWHLERMEIAIEFIEKNRGDFQLIVVKSHGSSLAGFKNDFIERNSEISYKLLTKIGERLNAKNRDISLFFFRNVSTQITNFFCDIIESDASLDEKKKYAKEFLTFVHSGYLGLLGIEKRDVPNE